MYKSFEDMPVWQHAFNLADEVYNLVEQFPKTGNMRLQTNFGVLLCQ